MLLHLRSDEVHSSTDSITAPPTKRAKRLQAARNARKRKCVKTERALEHLAMMANDDVEERSWREGLPVTAAVHWDGFAKTLFQM